MRRAELAAGGELECVTCRLRWVERRGESRCEGRVLAFVVVQAPADVHKLDFFRGGIDLGNIIGDLRERVENHLQV